MLKIIGAGYPRTGTTSLKIALEQLGFGPCHHMEELFKHPEQIGWWLDVAAGKRRDWATLLDGYVSACDFPSQHWYREILAETPGAKVILTMREPAGWYTSMMATIWEISRGFPAPLVGRFVPRVGGVTRLATAVLWGQEFEGRFLDRDHALARFQGHTEAVRAAVPAEDLLVFDVREGWEPLCRFLGVPVPATPFPRANDMATFQKRVWATKAACWVILLAPALLALGLGFALTR